MLFFGSEEAQEMVRQRKQAEKNAARIADLEADISKLKEEILDTYDHICELESHSNDLDRQKRQKLDEISRLQGAVE